MKETSQTIKRIEPNLIARRRTIATTTENSEAVNKSPTLIQSSLVNNGAQHIGEFDNCNDTNEEFRGTYSVAKIANEYERRAQKQKIHVASSAALRKRHTLSFFEGFKIPEVKVEKPSPAVKAESTNGPYSKLVSQTLQKSLEEPRQIQSNSVSQLPSEEKLNGSDIISAIVNGQLSTNNSDNHQPPDSPNSLKPPPQYEPIKRRKKAGQVETVEDILVEQRFSRSLSSYSISDLLKDQPPDPNIDQIINDLH